MCLLVGLCSTYFVSELFAPFLCYFCSSSAVGFFFVVLCSTFLSAYCVPEMAQEAISSQKSEDNVDLTTEMQGQAGGAIMLVLIIIGLFKKINNVY